MSSVVVPVSVPGLLCRSEVECSRNDGTKCKTTKNTIEIGRNVNKSPNIHSKSLKLKSQLRPSLVDSQKLLYFRTTLESMILYVLMYTLYYIICHRTLYNIYHTLYIIQCIIYSTYYMYDLIIPERFIYKELSKY